MSSPLLPNSELVAKLWLLAAVDGLDNNVATTLPDAPWPNDEFLRIGQVGGSPNLDVPQLTPVVSVECFAYKQGSTKPPWNKAAELAMRVWQATFQVRYSPDSAVDLNLPAAYGAATVQSVWPVSEVKRLPPDPSHYAVYGIDIAFAWVPSGLVIA